MPFLMALAQYHESLPESQKDRKELCESVAYRFFMEVEDRAWSVLCDESYELSSANFKKKHVHIGGPRVSKSHDSSIL